MLLVVLFFCLNIVNMHRPICCVESNKLAYLITLMFVQLYLFLCLMLLL